MLESGEYHSSVVKRLEQGIEGKAPIISAIHISPQRLFVLSFLNIPYDSSFLLLLKLTPERIQSMAQGLLQIVELEDPVGTVMESFDRPNGLHIVLSFLNIPYDSSFLLL